MYNIGVRNDVINDHGAGKKTKSTKQGGTEFEKTPLHF